MEGQNEDKYIELERKYNKRKNNKEKIDDNLEILMSDYGMI